MSKKIFYTYVHCKKTDGFVYYVGKGTNRRAWQFSKRNEYWKRVYAKYGAVVKIVREFEKESDALEHEKELIALMRQCGFELTNLTDGGEGTQGLKKTPEERKEISERVSLYFQNPVNVETLSNGIRKYYEENPEARARRSKQSKDYFAIQENKQFASDSKKTFYEENPESLAEFRRKHKEYFNKPENRLKQSALKKAYYSLPENRKKLKDSKSKQHFLHIETGQEFFSYSEAGRVFKISHTTVRKRVLLEDGYVNLLLVKSKGDNDE